MQRIFARKEDGLFDFKRLIAITFSQPNKLIQIKDDFLAFSESDEQFVYIRHIDSLRNKANAEECIYSGYKVHFNFADYTQTEAAWNALTPLLFAKESIVKYIKFVVPEWVLSTKEKYTRENIDNEQLSKERRQEHSATLAAWLTRRLDSTQLTLYLYCFKNTPQDIANHATVNEVDWRAYIHLLQEAEKILFTNGIKPQPSAFQPTGDTRLGTFTSIRRDTINGVFISYKDIHRHPPTSFIADFVKLYRAAAEHQIDFKEPSFSQRESAEEKNATATSSSSLPSTQQLIKSKLEKLTDHMLKIDASITPLIASFEIEVRLLKEKFGSTLVKKVLGQMLEDYLYLIRNVRTPTENVAYRQIINSLLVEGMITPAAKAIAIDTDDVMLDTSLTGKSRASLRGIVWMSITKDVEEKESLAASYSTTFIPAKK